MKNFLLKPSGVYVFFILVVGLLLQSNSAFAQPSNTCAAAPLVAVNCAAITGNFSGATDTYAGATCSGALSPDLWLSFVATKTDALIKLGATFSGGLSAANMRIEVFAACPTITSTPLMCGSTPLYVTNLIVGATYRVRISTTFLNATTLTSRAFTISICDNFTVDFSKSYVNVTDGAAGGTINPGDVLEIRGTFVVNGDPAITASNVSFFDTLQLGAGLNLQGTLASRTNEGKVYRAFTTPNDGDPGGVTAIAGLDSAIRINLGTGATAALGGNITGTSRPSLFNFACIIVATYRVKVNAAFGTKINIGGGAFRYSIGANNYVINFPNDSLIVYETLTACSDAASPGNLIGTANNGTFGTLPLGSNPAGTRNAGPATDINTSYGYMPIGVGAGFGPNDYFYARVNNSSPTSSIIQTAAKPDAGTSRVFSVFDITGDHTGATDPLKGNKPCNPALPVSATNPCGYLLVVNAAYRSDVVFEYAVTGACSETFYEVSAWFKNICYKCAADSLGRGPATVGYVPTGPGDSSGVRPNIAMKVDGIHYYTTGDIIYQGLGGTQSGSDTLNNWVRKSFVFKTLPGQSNFKITFANNAPGGGGNDWAIDDIELRTCYPTMIYAPPNPIAFVGNPLTLSDTIRSYFDSYRNYKWQRRPIATGVWEDIPGETGVGTPMLINGTFDYVVTYTIPGSATQPANSGDLYRVVVASNLLNLTGSCNFSPDVSFALFPVDAPCAFADTNRAIVPENVTINWNKLNWSLGHIPTCCESAQITYASTKTGGAPGNVVINNDICIINLTLINSSTTNLQLFKTVLEPTFNMYMRGNVRMQASSTFAADTCIFTAKGNNTINIDGNTEIGKPTDANAFSKIGSEPGAVGYINYILRGDSLTVNNRGFINNRFASFQLNPRSNSGRLINNTLTALSTTAVTFDRLVIGNDSAKTVTVGGTRATSFLNDNGGYLEVRKYGTLVMPANYSLNASGVFNSQVFLRDSSNLHLGGSSGGITGSNFPLNFNTYTLNRTSTVLFNGSGAQAIPGVSNNINPYGNLNVGGSGVKTASSGNTILAGNFGRLAGFNTFNANKGRFTFTNSGFGQRYFAQVGSSTTNFYDLTNNNTFTAGLSIDSTLGVINELELNPNSIITLNTGDIIMRSADSLTSHIKNLGTTIPVINYNTSYRFQIERYLFGQKSWRFLATPVQDSTNDATSPTTGASWRENYAPLTSNGYGTAITGLNSSPSFGATQPLDHQTFFPNMKYYNVATNNFIGINDARNYKLANAFGYMLFVRGDRGALNTADPSVLGTATTLRMKGKIRTSGQSFTVPGLSVQSVGNPYASQINFATLSKTGLVNAFVVWNPTLFGMFGVGGYENYVLNGGNYRLNGLAAGAIRNTIESGEAFFVQTNTGGTKTLTIAESDKGVGSTLVSRQGEEPISIPTIDVELFQKDATGNISSIDGVSTSFDRSFSSSLDNDDVVKFINTNNNLFIPKNNKRLVVEKRPALTVSDTINLGISGLSAMKHQFKITAFVLASTGLDAFLLDRFENKEIPLSISFSTNVDFDINGNAASYAQNRFSIIFKKSENNFTEIKAERNADKTVTVTWGIENEKASRGYILEQSNDGINFTALASKPATDNNGGNPSYSYKDEAASRAANWYRVKAEISGRADKYTAVASVIALLEEPIDTKSSIIISPNPVVNNKVNIIFKNMPQGNYDFKITNAAGQVMYSSQLNIQTANSTKNINPEKMASGVYQAIITDKNGKQQILKFVAQ